MKLYDVNKLLLGALLLFLVIISALYGPQINLKSAYFDNLDDTDVQQWLQQVPPLEIEVMAGTNDPAAGYVANFLAPLNRYWSSLTIRYTDPTKYPDKVREYGIKARGEMVIHYLDDHFVLSNLSYETLFNGLQRLLNPPDGWIVMLDGFGSQSLSPDDSDGLGLWLSMVQQLNYSVAALRWQPDMALPSDVKLIMLSNPSLPLPDEALQWLQQQLHRGVSLWWLSNPESMAQQAQLSLLFDVLPSDKAVTEISALNQYPEHRITHQFEYATTWRGVIPFAGPGEVVLQAGEQVFAVTQNINESRLLVIGDSDFINNSLLNSGGNQALSLRMLDWLMHHDNRINLPDLSAQQSGLFLSAQQVIIMSAVLLLGFPLLWLSGAFWVWITNSRRRRQENSH
ncbi:MAG: hypothetical protein DWP95_06345 [Proteobacteria bacterium]|nr:MAG: hypothetical protein DWP95_06345 [Pseudomonadota bacterium]